MAIGGLSLFLVCFVGFAALSGRDVSQVAVIGKLFPAPPSADGHGEEPASEDHAGTEEHGEGLSDAAVLSASLGVLSAWTLPSPYSSSELRVLSEELKRKLSDLEEAEHALARRERAVQQDEQELEERVGSMEELRAHLESLKRELDERELELQRGEESARAGRDASWTEVAGVIGAIEETSEAAARLQEYEPDEAAKILRAMGDDTRASELLNAVDKAHWKDYVAAYTAEKARASSNKKK
jgi:hypothetical protein